MTLFVDGTFSHKHWRVGNASQDYSGKWSSGNDDMDRFIQDEQLPIKFGLDNTVIPYGSFSDIEFIAEGIQPLLSCCSDT
ncbi:hypothetical protein GLOIN_2v1881295 [Rhizophagus irregularis DAOM 181602=DAOM 197198]|nr:hypothetical protein GLOIN_2v1881295 [Rhizophagus irregularis DAOM 181602=DAOM 197198]